MIIKLNKYLTKALNNNKNQSSRPKDYLLFEMNMICECNLHQRKHHLPHTAHHSSYNLFITVLCVISVLLLLPFDCVDAVGYSYTRFVGPVAGPEHRIYVNDAGNVQSVAGNDASSRLDYVAKPEYEFSYGVEDAEAHILHNRNEMRDGDAVKGVYSVVDPDGTLRVVKYTADEVNGFQAEVIMNGISSLHGQQQHKDGTPIKTYNNNYEQHYNQPQLKGAVYKPNLEQQINQYYPQSQYQTAPPSIIYHYDNDHYYNNNNNNDDGGGSDIDSGSDYNDDYQPQYEVREKPNENGNQNNGNDHEGDHNDDGEGGGNNKKKEQHDDDGEDSDSEDEYDESEELEDYEDAVRSNEASEESNEYY